MKKKTPVNEKNLYLVPVSRASVASERSEFTLDTKGTKLNKIKKKGVLENLRFKSIDNEKSNRYNL